MALLDEARKELRITTTEFDSEIQDLIDAARKDLILAGVTPTKANDDTDPLIRRAIKTYCKANFGFDNPDAERFQRSYEMLKAHLTLSTEYTSEV